MPRKLLDLPPDVLIEMFNTGKMPDDVNWVGVEDSPLFEKIFKKRHDTKAIAAIILREIHGKDLTPNKPQNVTYQGSITAEQRQQSLDIKERELALKEKKNLNATLMWEYIQDIKTEITPMAKTVAALASVAPLLVDELKHLRREIQKFRKEVNK